MNESREIEIVREKSDRDMERDKQQSERDKKRGRSGLM